MRIENDAIFLGLLFALCVVGGFVGIALGIWVFA